MFQSPPTRFPLLIYHQKHRPSSGGHREGREKKWIALVFLRFSTTLVEQTHLTGAYPLVICYIAIENGHRNSGFTHWKWWFSIAMLNYQRVAGNFREWSQSSLVMSSSQQPPATHPATLRLAPVSHLTFYEPRSIERFNSVFSPDLRWWNRNMYINWCKVLPLSDVCWLIKPMNYSFNSPTKHSLPRNQTIVTPPIRHSYWSYVHQLNDILNRPHHPPHPKHGTGEFCSASQLSVVHQIASPYPTLSDSAPCSESLPTVISWWFHGRYQQKWSFFVGSTWCWGTCRFSTMAGTPFPSPYLRFSEGQRCTWRTPEPFYEATYRWFT